MQSGAGRQDRSLEEEFSGATGVAVRQSAGSKLTTFAVGGPIERLIEPESPEQLAGAVRFLKEAGQNVRVIGGGSNLLIADTGLKDWVVRLPRTFRFFGVLADSGGGTGSGNRAAFRAGAAMSLMTLTRDLSEQGFSGLEFAGGIPASVGGAVRMNAGAHGGQMSDLIDEVTYVSGDGEIVTESAGSLKFSYRHSSLPADSIVVSVKLLLVPSDRESTARRRNENLAERKSRQPLHMPSAGSVFKNPFPDRTAGMLIEEAGLKGLKSGGAQISEMHANWIVNPERKAGSDEILGLIDLCREKVLARTGITIHPEVIYWSNRSGLTGSRESEGTELLS